MNLSSVQLPITVACMIVVDGDLILIFSAELSLMHVQHWNESPAAARFSPARPAGKQRCLWKTAANEFELVGFLTTPRNIKIHLFFWALIWQGRRVGVRGASAGSLRFQGRVVE